ncbi:hypothetical protein [Fluviibacter phosphoraccumulans]|jgi:hypothetical protein|uniref:Uncharacterized protein n=1 Tax=Fluviibacter phosphoraccumulans TaxID=1751046 RepID=A0A679HX23_9RHOO|nr:hypothetical protein [Fluviibacter phosphoraccumulans]BBU67883.1 hypothetical protein ICHIAU1_01660 [Fluviibacter phosphoraccumulans]BBU70578.1 hypothetical protein ICHIJ1_04970 [Fluviibacter phosphoraccumulans]BCA66071.1 hypothetical protein SHINM1_016730 [Fluviibacter phosphoraccumulans]
MDPVQRIIDETKGSIPLDSLTAIAIRNHCSAEVVASFAVRDGLQVLAASLFAALEVGESEGEKPLACVRSRLVEMYQDLPPKCQTAVLIASGARLEEISEAAESEGLISIAAMLAEAEQEGEN